MNKKLIVLAVAGVLAAPLAAQAGVEVYGQARMSVDFSQNNDSTAGMEDSTISVSSNASRLGFRGDEDLGDGLKAEWQIEQGLDMDTGAAFTKARNTYIGVNGGFGTVRVGKHDTPNKMASAPLDIFADTRADFNAVVGASGVGDVRSDNVIAYISPDMSGFTVAVAYIPSYTNDQLAKTTAQSDEDAYSLAGMYNNGPIYATLAYESLNTSGDAITDTKLGGSYDFGQGTKVGALYELQDDGTDDRSIFYINASHKMGANTFKAAYAMADEMTTDDGGNQFSLGVSHELSKATEAYALYTMVNNDNATNEFQVNGVTGTPVGEDSSSLSFGINHKFSSK